MKAAPFDVLIVDDSPTIRDYIRRAVELAGLDGERIHEAENGRIALDHLASQPVNLVLLDLNMQVMDGEAFLRRIRAREDLAGMAVIVVSTPCGEERQRRLEELGIQGFLQKPFSLRGLRELVLRFLDGAA